IFWTFAALFIVYGALGMFVIYLCLSGVRRIVWGDLGAGVDPQSLTKAAADAACQQHERDLIFELVRRTNRLRVAILLTGYEFGLLCIILTIGAITVIAARLL